MTGKEAREKFDEILKDVNPTAKGMIHGIVERLITSSKILMMITNEKEFVAFHNALIVFLENAREAAQRDLSEKGTKGVEKC